jgi:hypothetical protein
MKQMFEIPGVRWEKCKMTYVADGWGDISFSSRELDAMHRHC